jgi:hypothetical protein
MRNPSNLTKHISTDRKGTITMVVTNLRINMFLTVTTLLAAGPALSQTPNATPASQSPTPSPSASPPQKHRGFEIPKIGVDLGLFIPSDSKTRNRFGKSWTNIGIGIGRPDTPSGTGRVGLDIGVVSKSSGDHHAFVAPLGVYYRRAFNADDVQSGRLLIPYYGVSADLVVLDLRSPEDNVHSRFRLGYGGSAIIGTTIGASGFAEAKYLAVGKVKSFDLSGASFTVGVRF